MNTSDPVEVQVQNPYTDPDRSAIWEMVMRRDFEAFVTGDWSMVQRDFLEEGFLGIHAHKEPEPSRWSLAFPDVSSYRDEWLRQVREFAPVQLSGTTTLQFLYDSCKLEDIEIVGNRALARKKFDGAAETIDGREIVIKFQSLYKLVRHDNRWLITGFVGYLPYPMVDQAAETPW